MQARAPKLGETRAGGRSPFRPVRSLETDSQGADEVADLIGALRLEFVVARSGPSATPDGPPGWQGGLFYQSDQACDMVHERLVILLRRSLHDSPQFRGGNSQPQTISQAAEKFAIRLIMEGQPFFRMHRDGMQKFRTKRGMVVIIYNGTVRVGNRQHRGMP